MKFLRVNVIAILGHISARLQHPIQYSRTKNMVVMVFLHLIHDRINVTFKSSFKMPLKFFAFHGMNHTVSGANLLDSLCV